MEMVWASDDDGGGLQKPCKGDPKVSDKVVRCWKRFAVEPEEGDDRFAVEPAVIGLYAGLTDFGELSVILPFGKPFYADFDWNLRRMQQGRGETVKTATLSGWRPWGFGQTIGL